MLLIIPRLLDAAGAPILIAFGLAALVAIAVVAGLVTLAVVLIVRATKKKKAAAAAAPPSDQH